MKQVTINLYSFSELSKEAQQKAIFEHRDFMLSVPVEVENDNGKLEDYYYKDEDFEDTDVIDEIEANDYIFFNDGTLASCTTYTGKHPKSGITELKFKGIVYDITK